MSESYQEQLGGAPILRPGPGDRHELICERLHAAVQASIANLAGTRLLTRRSQIKLGSNILVCPDLALVASATGKLWLAAEVVSSEDHQPDTVLKKEIYEQFRLPRLWMIDPRYDNLEVYHGSPYGLMLKGIMAGSEILTERLLPEFQISVADLFLPPMDAGGHG